MARIKVITEISELVAIFHSCDTKVKRDVFEEVTKDWVTLEQIKEKYGKKGEEALKYLEKIKLVETQWLTTPKGPVKAYHTYYTHIQINMTIPILESGDIIYASTMSEKTLKDYERKIIEMIEGNPAGIFIGDIVKELGISQTLAKGIIKRRAKLEMRGHNVVVREDA